jgi:formate hydrogenlyase subunit 3/multisubunit Na+/H+ antiporter MnhD subunit
LHGENPSPISVMGAVKWICAAFAFVALLELIANPKNTGRRASFAFSLVLLLYGFALAYFTSDIARLLYYYLGRSPVSMD